MEIILASQSPRRIELLRRIIPDFRVLPSGEEETLPHAMLPGEMVEYLAENKARAVCRRNPGALVVGADTVVALENEALGKPRDRADAQRMLERLSGKVHHVYTGVALISPEGRRVFHSCTDVEFYPLAPELIGWYLDTGEPFDKAGAYGIQEKGALLVRRIVGDYFGVMGLPVAEVFRQMSDLAGGALLADRAAGTRR